ncbi:hypothetical protein HIM_05203 [Hirsutella minnesotensis 3608]|uniref:Uncharacterized protein n=1 Tax=Hirsutella minnesotensis 3608 TaxID=1043627 RepID=A0A0F8A0E6_9HYPO|nr:hypothetical protein HIM_05203 [Hirsutella minnesotensis 3608]
MLQFAKKLAFAAILSSRVIANPMGPQVAHDVARNATIRAPGTAGVVTGCQVQNGTSVPDLRPNLANPSKTDVERAIIAWLNEVCTVDSFLNNPHGATSLDTAIAWATDEPNQLKTLSSVRGLNQNGKNAAAILEANFPSVLGNLDNAKTGKSNIHIATMAINFDRCCTVLPAIGVLVRAAAEACGAFKGSPVPQPKLENVCARFRCQDAASDE